MFGRRKKRMAPPYDKAGKIPVIRSGICTGEQVAGFKDPETGKLIYRNVLARTQTECKTKLREAIKICGWIRKDSRLNPSRNRLSLSSSIRQGSGSALGLRCTPSRISGRLPRISTPISWKST